jgi:beta-glucanase (GH16 family)
MRARLAFGLVVILAVGALAGWRLAGSSAATQPLVKSQPQPTHSAPSTHIAALAPSPIGAAGTASIKSTPKPKPTPSPSKTAVSDLPPALTGSGWNLAFNAGFGSSLNTSQWQTCYPGATSGSGCTNFGNTEYEWYMPSQDQVSDGALNLVASRETTEGTDSSGSPEQYSCRSGMVTTAGSFNFEYGYVQITARIAIGDGLWPALWLTPSNGQWPPEIDIMEHWNTTGYYATYLHTTGPTLANEHISVSDLAGWHTFSVLWEPGKLVWYVDNEPVFSSTQYVPAQAMYFIANVAEASDPTAASDRCDGSMSISSVKIWQHS